MLCHNCNSNIEDGALFCSNCGTELKGNQKETIIRVGRKKDNDICIDNPKVSSYHAIIKKVNGKIILEDLNSTNGTYVNGKKITSCEVTDKDVITFGKDYVFNLSSINNISSNVPVTPSQSSQSDVIRIGRSSNNDIVINNIRISRNHAVLKKVGNKWILIDQNSSNGTFVNGKRITECEVTENDNISLGGIPVALNDLVSYKKESKREFASEVSLVAKNVTFKVEDKTIVDNISLVLKSGDFVGLIGPSGAGKTTLMMMLNGVTEPSNGKVLINNQSLYDNIESFKGEIGYVPQDDIIHRELTVEESLYFTAQLRFENKLSDEDIEAQVKNTIKTLGLEEAKDVLIGTPEKKGISGGQRKRVNMGQELMTEPSILFLDEPTSGLDPKTDIDVMNLLRKLADKGKIVVITTHNITEENFNILTHLIVLTKGGKLAYFGPANEACRYFGVDKPYLIFEKLNSEKPEYWVQKYKQSNYYTEHLLSRQNENLVNKSNQKKAKEKKSEGGSLQFWYLSMRYFIVKMRDKLSTAILLLQAPIIALLIDLVFNKSNNDPNDKVSALFVLIIAAIWLGCSNAAREIVSERSIFKRERMVNLRISSYVLSKVFILSFLCLIQSLILTFLVKPFLELESSYLHLFIILFTTSLSSLMMGLMVSSLVNTTEAAMAIIPIVLIPQVILGGLISKYSEMSDFVKGLASLMISRWSFEAILNNEFENQTQIISSLGFDPDNIRFDMMILIVFGVVFYYIIKGILKNKE